MKRKPKPLWFLEFDDCRDGTYGNIYFTKAEALGEFHRYNASGKFRSIELYRAVLVKSSKEKS